MDQRRRLLPFGAILIAACLAPNSHHELVAGLTGDRICGDSTAFIHLAGADTFSEGMILSPDSLRWVQTSGDEVVRLAAPIDHGLLIREAVTSHHFPWDSLGKTWVDLNGRLEIRRDSAQYAFGDQGASIQRGPIARDAAVMIQGSAAFDEILLRRGKLAGRDSIDIPTYLLSENRAPLAHIRFIRPDSATIRLGDGEMVTEATVDSVGRILSGAYQARGDSVINVRRLRCSR